MPRIEDESRDDLDQAGTEGTGGWRRRLVTWGLAAAALGLGFLIPYVLYLNHQVGERFGELRWQLPTRVYARPLALAPGRAMDAAMLKTELDAASYQDDGAGVRPGSYRHDGSRWRIASRGFQDVTGPVGPSRIEVVLSGGRVASLRDLARNREVGGALLDPARIATL
jgi:penicillin-binding protein 1B